MEVAVKGKDLRKGPRNDLGGRCPFTMSLDRIGKFKSE